MPSWVQLGVNEFANRLQDGIQVTLIEIPLQKRTKTTNLVRVMEKEAQAMQAAIPNHAYLIALDLAGVHLSSEQMASRIDTLQQTNSHLCYLIGGPEGLTDEVKQRAHESWALSKLTLPHPLVRVVFFEAIYRAWSILHNHPYHK